MLLARVVSYARVFGTDISPIIIIRTLYRLIRTARARIAL